LKEILLVLAGVVLGGAASWAISRYYYQRAAADVREANIAQRLDDCNEGDKTFLVALFQCDGPIPRYALINVEFETIDGRKGSWGSNVSTMVRSVNARASRSLQLYSGSNIDEDRQTISLSERGRENANFLLRTEYRSARFAMINDTDSQRLALFRHAHKREPRKGGAAGWTGVRK